MTYKTYYKLEKSIEDDPELSGRKAQRRVARFASLHPTSIAQKVEVTFLAPDIIEGIISGHQPADLTADRLIKQNNLPLGWTEQKRVLSFS